MGVPQEQARKWEKEREKLRVWRWEADPEVCRDELEQGAAVPKEQQPTLQGSFPAQGKSPKSYSTKTEWEKPQKGAFSLFPGFFPGDVLVSQVPGSMGAGAAGR